MNDDGIIDSADAAIVLNLIKYHVERNENDTIYYAAGESIDKIKMMPSVEDAMEKDKEVFCLRPMTCPFQYQVYLNKPRSYRDLPMRLGETSTLFRNERKKTSRVP